MGVDAVKPLPESPVAPMDGVFVADTPATVSELEALLVEAEAEEGNAPKPEPIPDAPPKLKPKPPPKPKPEPAGLLTPSEISNRPLPCSPPTPSLPPPPKLEPTPVVLPKLGWLPYASRPVDVVLVAYAESSLLVVVLNDMPRDFKIS